MGNDIVYYVPILSLTILRSWEESSLEPNGLETGDHWCKIYGLKINNSKILVNVLDCWATYSPENLIYDLVNCLSIPR